MSATVPSAITRPPSAPAPGPISTSQSAADSICASWSTNATEFPSATKSRITPFSPSTFDGCRPMDGSSKTYNTPVVRLRTARARYIRWRSPVESVDEARSRLRYPSPKSSSRPAATLNDPQMLSAMGRISAGSDTGTPSTQFDASESVILHAASSDMPRSFGARAAAHRRVPPQSGQTSRFKNFSTRFIPFSSFTFARAFRTVYTAL